MSILDNCWKPPGVQNGALERPGRPEMSKLDVSSFYGGGPFSPSARPALKMGPGSDFGRFWHPLGSVRAPFCHPLGVPRLDFRENFGSRQPVFEHFHAATFRRYLGPAECASAMQSAAPGRMEGARVFGITIIIPMQNPQNRRGLPLLTSPVAPRIPPGHPKNPGGSFFKPQNSDVLGVQFLTPFLDPPFRSQ